MKRPNILIMQTDQQRWDALGANGNGEIKTPNLDRLAAEGVNYDHFFVQNPVCMPSRYSFLTGRYCSSLNVLMNGVPVPEDALTLPHMLKNYGYTSANIGKLHFLPHANRDHRSVHPDYGFDHLEISDEPGCYEDAYRAWIRRKNPAELEFASLGLPPAAEPVESVHRHGDNVPHPPQRFPKDAIAYRGDSAFTHSAFVAEQTCEFIRDHQDSPFLCISGFYSPHSPWVAPQEFLDLYDPESLTTAEVPADFVKKNKQGSFSQDELQRVTQGYYAMVSEVDHHVGTIMAELESCGLADDTIVIFTSDHGEFLGERHSYGKGYPSPDCIARVPFIIRWPSGIEAPGRVCHHFVEAVDVVPALLEWAGLPVPRELQGKGVPVAVEAEPRRHSALTEMRGSRSLRVDGFQYLVHADGKEILHDLRQPHGAYRNVAEKPEYAGKLAELRVLLLSRFLEMERHAPRTAHY